MAGKSRPSFEKSLRERNKRRKREEKLQRKWDRREEANRRKEPGSAGDDGSEGAAQQNDELAGDQTADTDQRQA